MPHPPYNPNAISNDLDMLRSKLEHLQHSQLSSVSGDVENILVFIADMREPWLNAFDERDEAVLKIVSAQKKIVAWMRYAETLKMHPNRWKDGSDVQREIISDKVAAEAALIVLGELPGRSV